jgi:hypothetical protein
LGYNWRSSLGDYAATSGVLAGFCFALIVFVLGWNVSNSTVFSSAIYRQISVLVIGIASAFYIAATELFLAAKGLYVWELPADRIAAIQKESEITEKQWTIAREVIDEECLDYNQLARRFYNAAMFLIFLGIALVIAPFNQAIAWCVGGLGIALEVWQMVRSKCLEDRIKRKVQEAYAKKNES